MSAASRKTPLSPKSSLSRSVTAAQIALPNKLIPVFAGEADVRGAWGGRGSAKTRSFAKMAAVRGYMYGNAGIIGQILCARQFMNSLDDSSLEECKRAIQDEPFLADYYEIGEKYIKSKDGRIDFSFTGLDRNIASVKSKGRILLCWVDEAEAVNAYAWDTLIPTLREEGDDWNVELWVTWNPLRKGSATDSRFKSSSDPRYKIVQLNWRDNPKFPAVLERQRQRDLAERPDQYDHIWEGDYITAMSGAYYAKALAIARQEHRIGLVQADPLLSLRAFWDIGGTGAKADAVAIWIAQFVGREVRVIDYYEAVGQELSAHVIWMQSQGYTPFKCKIYLPHDGTTHDKVFDVTYESELKKAGYDVTVIKNQGQGAATKRIEALRKLFPSLRFDAQRCAGGLDALGWYHEKRDEVRNIGLGPDHDWSSHAADAAGLMAVVAEDIFSEVNHKPAEPQRFSGGGWMG
jgi:phage terminase large subunit